MLASEDACLVPPALLERVAADAAGVEGVDPVGGEVEVLRAREQSTVLEYRLDGGVRLIVKRYAQEGEALASYGVLRVLRERGFGARSPYRVAEPLACFAEWAVLVTRAVPGRHLRRAIAQGAPCEEGVRGAAGWLGRLHSLRVGVGPLEDVSEGLLRLARKAARAGAQHPELEGLFGQLIDELAARARSVAGAGSQVPTHGRYHAGHVFVAADSVAVVDLDRVAQADPAKDVGEFVHRLRAQTMRARLGSDGIDAAERLTRTFLEEYAAHAGGIPARLLYCWSESILSTLLGVVAVGRGKWEKRLDFYRAEFDAVPTQSRTFTSLVG